MSPLHHVRVQSTVLLFALSLVACGDDDGQANDNQNQNQNQVDGGIACGNGEVEGAEECDDGVDNSDSTPDACRTNCVAARCGDQVTDTSEQCDDGPGNSDVVPGACRSDCTEPRCGDGVVDVDLGEGCDCGDDPTTVPSRCTAENGAAGGSCRADCLVSFCGNGEVDDDEECDDGNITSGDGCSAACNSDETCGNGVVDLVTLDGSELCDDGNTVGGDGCSPVCQPEVCGNGVVDPDEVCDDGDLQPGDGCSPDCQSEEICGNGYVDFYVGEQCDDDNALSHDGCSSGCTGEYPLWTRYESPLGAINRHAMAFDSHRNVAVVFGGEGSCGVFCSTTWEFDGNHWYAGATESASTPEGRQRPALAFDSDRNVIVMFGGESSLYYDNTWEYDGDQWRLIDTVGRPRARSLTALAYDAHNGLIVLYGGRYDDGSGNEYLGDTWEYNGATRTWTERFPSDPPGEIDGHAMVYDEANKRVLLVGGTNEHTGSLEDTWSYDATAHEWTRLTLSPNPGQRYNHGMAYDPDLQRVVVAGGEGCASGYCSTTYALSKVGGVDTWALVSSPSQPAERGGAPMVYDTARDRVVLLGGQDPSGTNLGDTWELTGATWEDITGALAPEARDRMGMTFDSLHQELVMFGGGSNSAALSEPRTWLYSEQRGWRSVACAVPGTDCPEPRQDPVMVWDSARQVVVLYGGVDSENGLLLYDETWEWDGTHWQSHPSRPNPPGRAFHAMAYDADNQLVVLHGGVEGKNPGDPPRTDTWVRDANGDWSEIVPGPGQTPGDRSMHHMVYDSTRREVLLHSGISSGLYLENDIWAFHGTGWTELHPTHQPAGRGRGFWVFDPVRGRAVLFGGMTLGPFLNDLWEWDGSDWTRIYANNPSPRGLMAATWDGLGRRIAMFGGFDSTSFDDLYFMQYGSDWPDEVCDDSVDNDDDDEVDCADPDCDGQGCGGGNLCQGGACVTP